MTLLISLERKASALPAFYAFTGFDMVSFFAGRVRKQCGIHEMHFLKLLELLGHGGQAGHGGHLRHAPVTCSSDV